MGNSSVGDGKVQPLVIISMPNANDDLIKQLEQVIEAYLHGTMPIYITRQKLEGINLQDIKDIVATYEKMVK